MGNRLDDATTDLSLRFELPGGGRALFTTRAEGNLSTMRGPGHEHGRHERDRLCEQLGLRWLCASRQVHGTAVHRVVSAIGCGGAPVAIDADGHATALRDVGAMVLVADCLPVIVGSEGAVAALHAGWRGLAGGVLEEGVRAVRELGGEGEIAAVVGPGARGCCYEVGEEVHRALEGGGGGRRPAGRTGDAGRFGDASEASVSLIGRRRVSPGFGRAPLRPGLGAHREGRNLDLAALARDRLEAAGVARVEDVGVCTICDERFFSHRREGLAAGRQAGIAWLS
ncbi:MAG TPA: polyphenol oxidase family protein [Solirubrobacteraceae bacterium]|jgi:YfiH family protein|nr:polyphenol oxidase family protein [Solirubrobacteraceae bacterium]